MPTWDAWVKFDPDATFEPGWHAVLAGVDNEEWVDALLFNAGGPTGWTHYSPLSHLSAGVFATYDEAFSYASENDPRGS